MGEIMEKKLTLVVHGIGEQRPGETLDDLVGSLVQNQPYSVDSTVRYLRDDKDKDAEVKNRNIKRFPCNIRRVQNETYSNSFAEVYWADLSRGGANRITALFDLFRTTLGLGYIAIANAEEYANGITESKKYTLALTHIVVGAIHGPAAVISVLVGMMALVFYGISKLFSFFGISPNSSQNIEEVLAIVLTGCLAIFASNFLWIKFKGHLFRTFLKWLKWFGWGNIGLGLIAFIFSDTIVKIGKYFNPKCGDAGFCTITAYAEFTTVILGLTWVSILFATCSIMVIQWYNTFNNKHTDELTSKEGADSRCLLPETCILMSVLWMVLASTAWLVYAGILKNLPAWDLLDLNVDLFLQKSLSLSVVAWFILFCVVGASLYVHFCKRAKWSKAFQLDAEKSKAIERLVLNKTIARTLQFCGLALAIIITIVCLAILAHMHGFVGSNEKTADMMNTVMDLMKKGVVISGFFASAASAAFLIWWNIIGMGIGIIKDIIGYFAFQKNDDGSRTYFLRDEINHRFDTVLRTLIETENVTDVTVVSHSQGTVLALECLGRSTCLEGLAKNKRPKISLVTMGSPSQYIYNQYFQNAFDLDSKRLGTANTVGSWLNIHRADDFVGLDIEPVNVGKNAKPKNIEVPPGGHTGYWSDPLVRNVLIKNLFKEFK
jgi:hypothetical protein